MPARLRCLPYLLGFLTLLVCFSTAAIGGELAVRALHVAPQQIELNSFNRQQQLLITAETTSRALC